MSDDTPIYDALAADGFDPADVTPPLDLDALLAASRRERP